MRKFLFGIGIATFAINSSYSQENWISSVWDYDTIAKNPAVFATWVTERCSPRDNSGIQGIIIQSVAAARYTVFVWCRPDRSNTTWTRRDWLARDPQWREEISKSISEGKVALIGQILGSEISIVTLEK